MRGAQTVGLEAIISLAQAWSLLNSPPARTWTPPFATTSVSLTRVLLLLPSGQISPRMVPGPRLHTTTRLPLKCGSVGDG